MSEKSGATLGDESDEQSPPDLPLSGQLWLLPVLGFTGLGVIGAFFGSDAVAMSTLALCSSAALGLGRHILSARARLSVAVASLALAGAMLLGFQVDWQPWLDRLLRS